MPADFADSNVLLYLISAETEKARRAEEILRSGPLVSVQVLNEVTHVLRRKLGFDWQETLAVLELVRRFVQVAPLTIEVHESGLDLARRYGFSIWDAMIAASALHAGCTRLWSEDMQHGQVLAGVLRVANPFGGTT